MEFVEKISVAEREKAKRIERPNNAAHLDRITKGIVAQGSDLGDSNLR
jgi:hypothetical protein